MPEAITIDIIPHGTGLETGSRERPTVVRRCALFRERPGNDGIADDCEDWLQEIDRGGLRHVNSNMYMAVEAMELVLQSLLRSPGLA